MSGISQQFCVRWNSHLGSLGAAFPQLLAGQQFVDVTLACDGHQVHCHRLVLAACSSYFESLLSENPCKHPIIILPKEIKLWEIHALVDFMYKGQVNVSQAGLPQLLKCAETLQIRGLCGTDSTLNEVANGKMDRCDPTNMMSNNCSPNFNFSSMFASNLLNANYQTDDEQMFRQQHSDLQRSATFTAVDNAKTVHHRSNETLVKAKTHKNAHSDKPTAKDNCNATPLNTTKTSLKRLSENEASNTGSSELNIKCEEVDSDANVGDDGMDDDLDEHSNSKQSEYAMQQIDAVVDNDLLVISDGRNETTVAPHNGTDSNAHIHDIFPNDNSISITKSDSADDVNVCYSPSWSLTGESDDRPNRNDDLSRDFEYNVAQTKLPTSLKFNRNTMSIFVKTSTTKIDERLTMRPIQTLSGHNQSNFSDDSENIVCSPNLNHPIGDALMHDGGGVDGDSGADASGVTTIDDPNGQNGPFSNASGSFGGLHLRGRHFDDNFTKSYQSIEMDDDLKSTERRSERLMELLQYKDPLRSAVVLRSPRGNQPRSYTTDALYSALMDVKSGESIYRASQIHGVPRKTLRNWMKRWHIKSVYPMPYQLKKAAEKKRQIVQQNELQSSASTTQTKSELNEINEYNE